MSHLCAQFSPLCVGRAVSKLDEVECIVDVRLQFFERHMCADVVVLELTCQTDAYHWQWLGTYLLRQDEELVEAKSVTLVVVRIEAVWEGVVPAVLVEWSVLHRSYRVFPLVARVEVGTFDDASSREAEHAGVKVGKVLHEVGSQAVPVVSREERHMVEVSAIRCLEEYAQQPLLVCLARLQCGIVLLPVVLGNGDGLAVDNVVVAAHQFHADAWVGRPGVVTARGDGEVILHACLQSHAEVSAVLDTCLLVQMSVVEESHIVRVALVCGTLVHHLHAAERLPSHQSVGEFERTVLHQVGIKSAVGTEVDVLEEDAVHRWLYCGSWLIGLHQNLVLALSGHCLCQHEHRSCQQSAK